MNSSPVAAAAGELFRERDRVVGRLSTMPLETIPYAAVLAAVQELADLAADARGEPRRTVPSLAPHAAGDQVSVLVADVVDAAEPSSGHAQPELLDQATTVLVDLRRSIA
jgi:hypothetical protein